MPQAQTPIDQEGQGTLCALPEVKPSPEVIASLVHYEVFNNGARWIVGGMGRRGGQIGVAIGSLALKHAGGYEIVLRFPDGKIDSFSPMALFPAGET